MIGCDGQQSNKVAVSVSSSAPGLRDAQRIYSGDPIGRSDADDLLPFQAVVDIDLIPMHLP